MHNEIDIYKNCRDLQNLLNITLIDVIKPLTEFLKVNPKSQIIALEIEDAKNKAFEYIATQITTIGNASEEDSRKCLLDFPKSDVCYRCIGLDDDTVEGLIKIRDLSFLTFLELEDSEFQFILSKYTSEASISKINDARTTIKKNIDLIYANNVLSDNTRNLIKLVTRLVENRCTHEDLNIIGIPEWTSDSKSKLNIPESFADSNSDNETSICNCNYNSDCHPTSLTSTKRPYNQEAFLKAVNHNNYLVASNEANLSSLSVPNTPNAQKSRSVGGSEELLTNILDKPPIDHSSYVQINRNQHPFESNHSPSLSRKKLKSKAQLKNHNHQLQRSLSHEFESTNNLIDNASNVNNYPNNTKSATLQQSHKIASSSVFQFPNEIATPTAHRPTCTLSQTNNNLLDKERRSSYEDKFIYKHSIMNQENELHTNNQTRLTDIKMRNINGHKFDTDNKFGITNFVKIPHCVVCKSKKIFFKFVTCEICRIKVHKSCLTSNFEIMCTTSPNIERKNSHNSIVNIPSNPQGSDSNSASSCNSSPASPFNLESGYNSGVNNHLSPRHPFKLIASQKFEFSVIDEAESVKSNQLSDANNQCNVTPTLSTANASSGGLGNLPNSNSGNISGQLEVNPLHLTNHNCNDSGIGVGASVDTSLGASNSSVINISIDAFDDDGSRDSQRIPHSNLSNEQQGLDQDLSRMSINRMVQRLESTESQDEFSRLSRTNSISVALKDWEIPLENLEIIEQLGKGSLGTVYRGKWHGEVAIKFMDIDTSSLGDTPLPPPSSLDSTGAGGAASAATTPVTDTRNQNLERFSAFKNEVAALHKTRHENLVLFMGACMKPPRLAIITQLSQGETLYHQLHTKHISFPVIRAINIASQVAKGMGYLHAKNILHKDLKSRNIFIENNCKAVISDFGLFDFVRMTKQSRWGNYLKVPNGWLCYLSPELIKHIYIKDCDVAEDLPFSKQSDIYAFGTIWFEILHNKWPYEGLSYETIIYRVGKGIKESLKLAQAKEFKELLLQCWCNMPDQRPQFTQIVQLLEKLPKLQRSPSYPVKSVSVGRNHDNLMT